MIYQFVFSKWQQIPMEVKRFLGKAFFILIVWQLLYGFYLYPNRVLDDALTHFTGYATEQVLLLVYGGAPFKTEFLLGNVIQEGIYAQIGSSLVSLGEQPLISIADSCNGLGMYALFIGFLVAFPGTLGLKLRFGTLGLMALIAVNVGRCVALASLQIHYPTFTVFAHHYIFNVLTYAAVFGLWYWFTKRAVR
jgi:exosortase/archaeosortase family protein